MVQKKGTKEGAQPTQKTHATQARPTAMLLGPRQKWNVDHRAEANGGGSIVLSNHCGHESTVPLRDRT